MKKRLLFIMLPLLAGLLNSCSEEDAALQFETESVSDSKNVQIDYHSPDPGSVAKQYYITANSKASEIKIKCKSHNAIYFDSNDPGLALDPAVRTSQTGHWTARVSSPNTITFTFNRVNTSAETENFASGWIMVSSNSDDEEKASTFFSITRLLRSDDPLDEI